MMGGVVDDVDVASAADSATPLVADDKTRVASTHACSAAPLAPVAAGAACTTENAWTADAADVAEAAAVGAIDI